jgi:ABC-type transporter Mla subunit MlaD
MEKVVGVFVLFILGLLTVALFVTAQRREIFDFQTPLIVRCAMDRGYEFKPGAPVLINEVEAGSVSDVSLDTLGRVELTIRVEGKFKQHVGKPSARVDGKMLQGSEVLIDRPPIGSPKINITSADPKLRYPIEKFPTEVRLPDARVPPSVIEKLAAVKDDFAEVKDEVIVTLRDVAKIIENIRATTEPIAQGKGTVGMLIHDEAFAETIERTLADVKAMTTDLKAVTGNVKTMTDEIQPATTGVLAEVDATVKSVQEILRTVNALLGDVTKVVATVGKALGEAEAIVHNIKMATDGLPEVVRKSDRALLEANRVIDSLKRNILIRGNLAPAPVPPREAEAMPRTLPPVAEPVGDGVGEGVDGAKGDGSRP